ncbi:hypothetical protein [Mesonia sp. K4-1]|uniref:hypothetical protein n=1 Tax=Mesonia sp. K4-1 TaxID=2602760 RepID=UPI0011CBFD96|nr:hypothetical protein [Mesonia sp. K4-1]TXK78682.1 hypothetical protein FT986_02495 [Mesonia sp. K4-1]
MVINIQHTSGEKSFKLNGKTYVRNFHAYVSGDKIRIVNAYDTRDELLSYTHYSQFSLNGNSFQSANEVLDGIALVLFRKIGDTVEGGGNSTFNNIRITNKYIYINWSDNDNSRDVKVIKKINQLPNFNIPGNEIVKFYTYKNQTQYQINNYNPEIHWWEFKLSGGNYGFGGTQLQGTTSINYLGYTLDNYENVNHNLGEIGTVLISAYINANNEVYQINTDRTVIFQTTRNGVSFIYHFIGNQTLIGNLSNSPESQEVYESDFSEVSQTPPAPQDLSSFATRQNLDDTQYDYAHYHLTDVIANADPNSLGGEDFVMMETDTDFYFGQKISNNYDFINCRLLMRGNPKFDFPTVPDVTQNGYKFWLLGSNDDWGFADDKIAFRAERKFVEAGGGSTVELVDALTSTATDKALTANQGRILKGFIDAINTLLSSDDTTLDELQEIVDYIKQNKDDLQNLSIGNIAGLQGALDNKLEKGAYVGTAEDLKTLIDNLTANKADKYARVNISSSGNLLPVHNGKLLIITGSVTLTYSGIYPDDFNFNIKVLSGGQLTIAKGNKILKDTEGNSVAQLVAEEHSFGTSYEVATGEYMMEGNLI